MKPDTTGVLDPELLQQYAIGADFEDALQNGGGKVPSGGVVSVKSSRKEIESGQQQSKSDHGTFLRCCQLKSSRKESKSGQKRSKSDHGSKSSKRKKSQH